MAIKKIIAGVACIATLIALCGAGVMWLDKAITRKVNSIIARTLASY